MKNVILFLSLSLALSAFGCATLPPDEAADGEDVAEAESAVGEACSSQCDCALGNFCYIPEGQGVGTCIVDLFGPPDPNVCWDTCQCPSGTECDPAMHCSVPECNTDCDCPAGDLCFRGQCVDDFYNPWSQCAADCHCPVGQSCHNGTCSSGEQEP